jgi:SAM-dependent methyltransferase
MAFRRRLPVLLDYLELQDGSRVLDCGCGMGFQLLAMSRLRRLELVGLDPDPERLAYAAAEGVPAELVQGDAQQLPFADASFDAVLMTEVLEHVPDDRRALREVLRVLRPGGVLALSVPNARYPFWWDPIAAVRERLGREPLREGPLVGIWTNHLRLYRAEELVERVAGAGLALERVEQITHACVPFEHFLVYGVGKPLVERRLLPAGLHRSADRFHGDANEGSLRDPFNLVRAAFRLVDRLNEPPRGTRHATYVNVLVKARRPGRSG